VRQGSRMAVRLILLAVVAAATTAPALAADKGIVGTTTQELKDWRLRPPSVVKVAVLPFQSAKGIERQTRVAASAIALSLMRCGFDFAPGLEARDAQGLGTVLCAAEKAVAAEPDIPAWSPLQLADAVRVGRSLGADWVVFGEVLDLHSFTTRTVFALVKKGTATIRLQIADVASGELILYRQCQEGVAAGPGLIGSRKGTALERDAAQHCLQRLYADLCTALPTHRHDPKEDYDDGTVLSVREAWEATLPEETVAAGSSRTPGGESAPVSTTPSTSGEMRQDAQLARNDLVAYAARGEVAVEVYVAEAGMPGSLMAIIANNKGTSISIEVTPGTMFTPGSERYGRVVASKVTAARSPKGPRVPTGKIELDGHETKAFYLEAYALEIEKEFPRVDTRLQMGRVDDAAHAVLAAASVKEASHRVIQAALWMKASGATVEEVARRLSLTEADVALLAEIESSAGG